MKIRHIALLLLFPACILRAAGAGQPSPASRSDDIRRGIERLDRECLVHSQGDWDKWFDQLAPFRSEFKAMIETRDREKREGEGHGSAQSGMLKAIGEPPMYLDAPSAGYLVEDFREKPVVPVFVAVSRWLKRKGIDLIVVPVPKMPEVYPDRIVSSVPPDRIVAPRVRQLLKTLLLSDVEVVDLLPVFLDSRARAEPILFLPADSHWSGWAQRLAAGEIAERLKRYPFIRQALDGPAIYRTDRTRVAIPGSIWPFLNDRERHELSGFTDYELPRVTTVDGRPFCETRNAPVMVIGDSYTDVFQLCFAKGTGIDAWLAEKINLPVSNVSSAGATVAPLKEIGRNPELLRGTKVVVWIVNNTIVTYNSLWDLPSFIKP